MKLSRLLREQRDSARMSAFGAHPYRTRAEHERRFGVRREPWQVATIYKDGKCFVKGPDGEYVEDDTYIGSASVSREDLRA